MRRARFLAAFASALPSVAAQACTVCDSSNGQQLRAGLFNGSCLHTFLLVAAPIPVFAVALSLVHLVMPDLHLPERDSEPLRPAPDWSA